VVAFEYKAPGWRTLFEELTRLPDCAFVVVTLEESLDLGAELNDAGLFPWDDWRLVMAEIKGGGDGKGVRRRGAAYERVA
jgi:hypothetical protein